MITYEIGTVVLVKFPFTDLETQKKRPALVLKQVQHSTKIDIVNIAMITSKIDSYRIAGDVHLKAWQSANLLHPSLVRLAKIATVDSSIIPKVLRNFSLKETVTEASSVTSTSARSCAFCLGCRRHS